MRLARALTRELLAPPFGSVTPAARFRLPHDSVTSALGRVPQAVVLGFELSFAARSTTELHDRLALIEELQRGFAYEGATMGCAIQDALSGQAGRRTGGVMSGPGSAHLLLNFIGLGFAMARLPRRFWPGLLPRLSTTPLNPTMNWLVVDGYGFDLAYFDPERYIVGQERPAPYPWNGDSQYFLRAVDQGIGRAVWFASGADPYAASVTLSGFPVDRQADLASGLGLAATFAGPADQATLLPERLPSFREQLAVGALFAFKGRSEAGFVPGHTVDSLQALAAMAPHDAGRAIDSFEVPEDDGEPVYEQWRRHLGEQAAHVPRVVVA